MKGRRLLFYGNCQVQYIARVFSDQITPLTGDTAIYADINHTDFAHPHHIQMFRAADVLIDQVFDAPDPIPQDLVDPRKPRLRIPNMRGDFLWPYGTRALPPHHAQLPEEHFYAHEYGDTYLNRMITRGVPARAAVDAYLDVDLGKERNLGRVFELSMDRQRRRDIISGISLRRTIRDRLGSEVLFFSPGHPCERLLHLVARPVLDALVGASLASRALQGQYHGFPAWRIAPIHPAVSRFFSLSYASVDTRYMVYEEGWFTFEEYALRYMRGEHVPALWQALRDYHSLQGKELLALAYTALRAAPGSPLAHRLICQAFRREGRADLAVDTAMRSAALEPQNWQNMIEIVSSLKDAGDVAGAEIWARIGLSRFPREAAALFCLCDVLAAKGDGDGAARYARAALDLHPGSKETRARAEHFDPRGAAA